MMAEGSDPPAGADVTDDAFLDGQLRILQPRQGYRAGVDAVLLAATVPPVDRPARVLDAGAGVGTVGLSVARRIPAARVVLLEAEAGMAALARENISRNGLGERVTLVEADLLAPPLDLARLGVGADSFDRVLANPPYHTDGRGTPAGDGAKARAHAMAMSDLEHWLRVVARVTASGGTATIIHKAEALGALLAAASRRLGAIKVLPIHPREGQPAHRVIVSGVKGSRAPSRLLAGFTLHGPGNAFLPRAEAILRRGEWLDLDAAI
ncbi:MAG: methyltransferase [Pseudomonadota bacterium]